MLKTFFGFLAVIFIFAAISIAADAQTLMKIETRPAAKDALSKLTRLPTPEDDRNSRAVLQNYIQKSEHLTGVDIAVEQGLVILEGRSSEKAALQKLIETANRLPTVIAVQSKVAFPSGPLSDLSPFAHEMNTWADRFMNVIPRLVAGIMALIFFYFLAGVLSRLSHYLWSYRVRNPFLLSTVAKFSMLPFYILMFYMLLLTLGLQNLATTIIGGTGVLGLVLGLAFKGIVENFFSGILLATRSPFTKGDLIEVEDIRGIVQNLNMRGTTVMDNDGTLILIPNTMVVQSVIQNFSANPATRASFSISLGLESSITEAQKVILEAVNSVGRVLKEPAPLALVDKIDSNGVSLMIYFWFDIRKASFVGSRSRVISVCIDALQAAGIDIQNNLRVSILGSPEMTGATASRTAHVLVQEHDKIERTHNEMMGEVLPEESLKKMAREATLPGNSQSPDLLKPNQDSNRG